MPPILERNSHERLISKGWIRRKASRAQDILPMWGNKCSHKITRTLLVAPQAPFARIRQEIENSKQILALEDDWDGEGSPRYTSDVWKRATGFLMRHATYMLQHHDVNMSVPNILPGPNGSIDVHWKSSQAELLLNFPADANLPAGFYGDDYNSVKIKGQIKTNGTNEGLLVWLKSHQ